MDPQAYLKKYGGETSEASTGGSFSSQPSIENKDNPIQGYLTKYSAKPTTADALPSDDKPQGLPSINVSNSTMLKQADKGQYNGYCQRFVEDATYGKHGQLGNAIDAWHKLENKKTSFDGIKPGDLIYFDADKSNENYGHVGIYIGDGVFRSATYKGIKDVPVSEWMKQTGQKPLGYVPIQ